MGSKLCHSCGSRRARVCAECARAAPPAPAWTPFLPAVPAPGTELEAVGSLKGAELWLNSRYQVAVRRQAGGPWGPMVHLSVRRLDRAPLRDWRDLQRIKDDLVGPEAEGVELFPAESRLVDSANQYHIYAFPAFRFPFGADDGRLVGDSVTGRAVQRPFDDRPADALSGAALDEEIRRRRSASRAAWPRPAAGGGP